jgi:hypothetical protein
MRVSLAVKVNFPDRPRSRSFPKGLTVLLQDKLLELGARDRRVIRAFVEVNAKDLTAALNEYQALRTDIREQLLDPSVVSISDTRAVALLQKITTGEGLLTDKLLKQLYAPEDVPNELDGIDLDQLGSDLFYSWFSDFEYIKGLAELRPLAIRGEVGESVSRLIRQIKNCYALQQYEAAFSLCRTAVEASVRDICVQRKLFPDLGENVILFEEFKWSTLRDRVSSGQLRERLLVLYRELSTVLHGRRTVSKEEARHAFENTLQTIERLYAAHNL